MQKKFLYFFLLFLLVSVFLVPHVLEKKNKEMKDDQKAKYKEKIEQEIEKAVSTGDFEKDEKKRVVEEEVFEKEEVNLSLSGVAEEISLEELKKYYSQALMEGGENVKIHMLESIYEKTGERFILQLLIEELIKVNDYEGAYEHLKILYEEDKDLGNIEISQFFYVMFNALELNDENLEKINGVLEYYFNEDDITQSDFYFYKSLIALSKLNVQEFKDYLAEIDQHYENFRNDVSGISETYTSYKNPPEYYYYGLLSFVMFQYKYFGIAEKLSEEALKFNEEYILPYQVLAYSNFTQQNWDEAVENFKKLIEIDYQNESLYKFFLGISHYWSGNYDDSVIFLSQIQSSSYKKDVYRYLILNYRELGDKGKVIKNFEKLSEFDVLSENDFYTFFNMVFYSSWKNGKGFELFNSNQNLVKEYLIRCYKRFKEKYPYICRYGKAGYHIAKDQREKAFGYLNYLVDYYPRNYIYKVLAKRYYQMGKYQEAKKNYVKALIHSSKDKKREFFKNRIVELMMEKKKALEK